MRVGRRHVLRAALDPDRDDVGFTPCASHGSTHERFVPRGDPGRRMFRTRSLSRRVEGEQCNADVVHDDDRRRVRRGGRRAAAEGREPRAGERGQRVGHRVRAGVARMVVRNRDRVETGAAQERRGPRPRLERVRAEGRAMRSQRERGLEVGDGEVGSGDLVTYAGEEPLRVGRRDRRHPAAEHDVAGEDEADRSRARRARPRRSSEQTDHDREDQQQPAPQGDGRQGHGERPGPYR